MINKTRSICKSLVPGKNSWNKKIGLPSNVLKGASRNPKHGKKKGGIKVNTVPKTEQEVPYNIHFILATTHDHVMLAKLKLASEAFMYYIDLCMFCENPEKAWLKIIDQSNLSPPEPLLFD
ncbi:hypothetical protein [Bacteroides ihuae]|uniref:hypothetical protein n=1 Tax=Bacteroides ihuae TaxID=1852362 RepID=UPI0008DA9D76|nr:hypothetical protein [Bacteroides ihuae]